MINYKLKVSKFKQNSSYGKYFARAVSKELIDIEDLAKLMKKRNLPYSTGVIKGLLEDMVACIKEQLLAGNSVKIDDLAIFSITIKNVEGGAPSEKEFNTAKHIDGVSLNCRPAGELMGKNVKTELEFNRVENCDCDNQGEASDEQPDDETGNQGNEGGDNGDGDDGGFAG